MTIFQQFQRTIYPLLRDSSVADSLIVYNLLMKPKNYDELRLL